MLTEFCNGFQGRDFAHRFSERIARFFAKKWANEWFAQKMSDLLICSFLVSDLTDLLMVAHFWWATWANRSWSLIFDKQCEWIPYNRSFVLSDLIELLTVAYLIWAIWANERIPNPELWSSGQLFKVFLNGIDIAKSVYTVQCVHSRIWPKIVKQTNLSKKQQP